MQWINKGITLPLRNTPQHFHYKNPQWSEEEQAYWTNVLLPKMLQEGAVR
jgi:hypothetical protein